MQFVFSCFSVLICTICVCNATKDYKQNNSTVNKNHGLKDEKYFLPAGNVQDFSLAPVITSKSRTLKSSSYLLTWRPGSELSSVKFYKIRYRKDLSSLWQYATILAESTSLRLSGLESSTLYEVEMIEVLSDGRTSQLAMSSFRTGNSAQETPKKPNLSFTPEVLNNKGSNKPYRRSSNNTLNAQVPGAPSLPSVKNTSPTSVSLMWRPRSNGGSPITGYKIQIRSLGHGKRGWKTRKEILPPDTRTYTLNGLKRGASYKFRVIAVNAIGESVPSQSTSPHSTNSFARKEPATAPHIIDVTMENGSLVIHWQYDEVDPASFDGFLLKYHTKEKRGRKRIRNPSVTSYVIKEPLHGRMYSVKLQAYNSVGNSPESQAFKFRTVKDKVNDVEKIRVQTSFDMPSIHNAGPLYPDFDAPDVSPHVPDHNEEVKARASRTDLALVIGGTASAVVIIVLVVITKLCRKKSAQQKKIEASSGQNETKENSNLCTKIVSYLCCRDKPRSTNRPQIPSTPPRCSCYSGTGSPPQMAGSCVQSNRTSMSHSIVPDNGHAPAHPNPTYTVYYDYSPARPPLCCAPQGIPLWWVRGATGEFCHIVPHSARPKVNEELMIKTIEEQSEDIDVSTSIHDAPTPLRHSTSTPSTCDTCTPPTRGSSTTPTCSTSTPPAHSTSTPPTHSTSTPPTSGSSTPPTCDTSTLPNYSTPTSSHLSGSNVGEKDSESELETSKSDYKTKNVTKCDF